MNSLQDVVRAIGVAPLTKATEACYLRSLLNADEEHPALSNLLYHLVSMDHSLLEKIARSPLRDSQPNLIKRLLAHSYCRAATGKGRAAISTIAHEVRLASCLPLDARAGHLLLTEAQEAALEKLEALMEVYFSEAGAPSSVQMRIAPLLVAPSGSGKTFLAGLLARRNGLGLFRTSVNEWMVQGSKANEPTLALIRDAIDANPQGLVLHVDELDKLFGNDSWNVAQRGEIFCCAGDREVAGAGWTEKHRAALRARVFIIGSGTWQEIWSRQLNRHRGFSEPDLSTTNIEKEIRAARVIPDELLFRWGPMIPIHPYTERDFERIGQLLGLERQFLDPIEGARSGLNFRAIELALSQRALAAHRARV